VSVIGVAEDPDSSVSTALAQQAGLTFPIVYDREHALAGRYRVGDLPATFVLDRSGVVRWKTDRACQRSELEAVLDSLK
jgi:peroxiredoxin